MKKGTNKIAVVYDINNLIKEYINGMRRCNVNEDRIKILNVGIRDFISTYNGYGYNIRVTKITDIENVNHPSS